MKQLLVLAAVATAASSFAQINYSGSYFQDFDSLPSGGTGITWNDNLPTANMQGWYASQGTFDADNGNATTPGLYSYGTTVPGERALGSVSLPGALIVYGLRMLNTSGSTITSLSMQYYMEQWRRGSNTAETVDFGYQHLATNLFGGTWLPNTALDLNAVNLTGLPNAIDGNDFGPPNKVLKSSTINGLNWTSGSELWVRWLHQGNSSGHGLAIDEFHIQTNPVPEPFTMGLALAGLGMAARRRMKARGA